MNRYKYCCLFLVSLILALNSIKAVNAEQSAATVKTNVNSPVYLSRNTREYTFKAPDSKTLSNSGNLTAVQGYKVEVYGSATDLLAEVRNIEPKAFVKGDIIQVGIFSSQNNAEDMVGKLAAEGFWARIIAP